MALMQATMLAAVSNICSGPVATTPMRSSLVIPWGSVGGKNGTAAGSSPGSTGGSGTTHGIDHVLDRGLHQPQVAEDPEQEHWGQEGEGEQIEAVAEFAGLADERDGNDRAGQGAQVQGGAAVGLGDGAHAGGLQVELLGGER